VFTTRGCSLLRVRVPGLERVNQIAMPDDGIHSRHPVTAADAASVSKSVTKNFMNALYAGH
jgi:hypothetical protein